MSNLRHTRKFKYIKRKKKDNIRVISYNILAPSVSNNDKHMTSCSSRCINWNNRFKMILKEVLELKPDIICFQEMQTDKFYDNFLYTFLKNGYYGIYTPQKDMQKSKYSLPPEKNFGVTIFFKFKRFHILENGIIDYHRYVKKYLLNNNNTKFIDKSKKKFAGLKIKLLDTYTKKEFYITNVHFEHNPIFDDIKNLQAFILLKHLRTITNKNKLPVILCGDFNSKPNSNVYYGITKGISKNDFDLEDFNYPKPFIKTPKTFTKSPLISSYYKVIGKEPYHSNYTKDFKETLDYIFVNDKVKINGVLKELDLKYIKNITSIPNNHFPSDHFMQCSDLYII